MEKKTKARAMEYQARVERGSQPGSRVGSVIDHQANEAPTAPAVDEDTLRDKLKRFLKKPLENQPLAGSREGSVSHGSILGTRRGFGGREARVDARRDEGLAFGSKVTWQKAQERTPKKALVNKTGPAASHMEPTARFLLRDKLLHQATDADMFDGDKSKFIGWLNRLTQDCEEIDLSSSDIIRALRARTKGKPREIVDRVADYSGKNPGDALDEILKKLKQRFGSGPEIADDIREKINNISPYKSSDKPEKLQDLADLAAQIAFVMKQVPELRDLNTSHGLKAFRHKLPYELQRRWQTHGNQYELRHENPPPFSEFAEFLNHQADMISNPHYRIESTGNQRGSQKEKPKESGDSKGSKVLKTVGSEAKGQSQEMKDHKTGGRGKAALDSSGGANTKDEGTCFFHPEGKHSLTNCRVLRSMPDHAQKIALERLTEEKSSSTNKKPQ